MLIKRVAVSNSASIALKSCFLILFSVLIFLNINAPTVFSLLYVKAALFLLCCFISVLVYFSERSVHLSRDIVIVHLIFTILLTPSAFMGIVGSTPGISNQIQVYIFWPFVHLMLIAMFKDAKLNDSIIKLQLISSYFMGVFGTLYVFVELGFLNSNAIFDSILGFFGRGDEGATSNSGYVEFNLPILTSAGYTAPFFIAYFLMGGYKRPINWIMGILIIVAVILSGRRALWLVVAISPILTIFSSILVGKFNKIFTLRSIFIYSAAIVPVLYVSLPIVNKLELNSASIYQQLTSSYTESDLTTSGGIRKQQVNVLITEWQDSPIIGNGLGAVASLVRSDGVPWSYEAYYYALLFQGGLITFFAAVIFICFIFQRLYIIGRYRGDYKLAITYFVSLTTYLLFGATNPYLARFDGFWVFLFPLILINKDYLTKRNKYNG
ncbi:hypothetical protein ACFFLM_25800 [Deinococcus oregonensis]|uniref:O-antigen polymerase n=1 Tax=Deinococcus oregonensis TaxID=1805970 RepID=A0ABV6B8Q8_9DEIO